MTLRHLEIFAAVYRQNSITRAAERLHMTQPAVSVAVRELEKHYGVILFERLGRRLYPTDQAHGLYERAVHILESFWEMEQGLGQGGCLRIGSSVTLGNVLLPKVAAVWRQRHPNWPLQVTVANGGTLRQKLRDGELDAAVIECPVADEALVCRTFRRDRLVLVLPEGHPLTAQADITLAQALEWPLLAREPGSAGRSFVEQVLAQHGLKAQIAWESIDTQALLQGVRAGLGVAFLPEALAAGQPGLITRQLRDEPFCRENMLVWHRHKRVTPQLKELMELLCQ